MGFARSQESPARWPLASVAVALALFADLAARGKELEAPSMADAVLLGRFLPLDSGHPEATAIAVRDGRIVAIGSRAGLAPWIGASTRRIELPGFGVPGFAEGHGHAESIGEQQGRIDLHGLAKPDVITRIREAVRTAAKGAWIRGEGWDQGHWTPPAFPTAADLNEVAPDHPVFLDRVDYHSAWLNSRALALAGITKATADPKGGRIVRGADGAPTGILVDEAVSLGERALPRATPDEPKARLRAALDRYVHWGVTSLHDAGVDLEGIGIYKELQASRALPLRAYVMARGEGATAEHYLSGTPEVDLGGRFTIRCFKVVLDGALGSRGAQLAAPYADAPSETGLGQLGDAALKTLLERATARGFQVAAHAIGDRAIHRALDAFEAGGAATRALRPRIEHVSVVDPSDLPRLRQLGVIASMQPNFVGEYGRWALDRLGPQRIGWVLPTRRFVETGTVVASGTDFPASDSGDPVVTLYSLVTRKGAQGEPEGGLVPDQRLEVEAALRTMTQGPAFAAFQEEQLGVLSVGRFADLTVLSADPRSMRAESLRELRVLATVVGGEVVYALN